MQDIAAAGGREAEPAHRPEVVEARRAQIIAAAQACIAAKGYDATTIRDVAVAASVSTGTVNYYFPNKEALLISALQDLAADFGRRVHAAAAQAPDSAFAALVALVEASLPDGAPRSWHIWMEYWAQAYRHAGLGHVHAALYRDWRGLIARTIARGVAAGELAPVDAPTVARQLAGLADGLAIHCIVGDPETPVAEVRRLLLDFLRAILQPREEGNDGR